MTDPPDLRARLIALRDDAIRQLAEARDAPELKADIAFSRWCEDNGFGEDVLNKNERAAAIAMGREPEALRQCLETTTRSSLQYIYHSEFSRFPYVRKPRNRRRQPSLLGAPPRQRKKAEAVYDELAAGGAPISVRELAEKAGVSEATAAKALLVKRVEAETEPLDPAAMRATMRKRYEATVRAAKKALHEEITAEVTAAICHEYDGYLVHLREREAWAQKIIAGHNGFMSRDIYRKIKACLHPDHNTFTHAAEALNLFTELEAVLVKPEGPVFSGPPLPTTAAELMARRRQNKR